MSAQSIVKGVVTDPSGEPVIGATVKAAGSKLGVITDLDGKFSIDAAPDATLTITYVGMEPKTVKAQAGKTLTITLKDDAKVLNDVVVIGYGVQKKSDLTGAVASIKSDDIKGLSATDAGAALQGKAAGVQIINSGGPGEAADIRIRGYSSNSGNIGPLLIVDGLKVDNIQYLDPSMIESMEVLKDAASAAIYGAQAGNGVVIITTKTGAANGGKAQISYSSKFTIQSLGKKADLFDANEYIEYHKYIGDLSDEVLQSNNYQGQNTDWYKEVFDSSLAHQHSLTLQASNGKGRFLASLNILSNDGIVKGSKDTYKRFTGQINADYDIYKWLNVTTNTSFEKYKTKGVTKGYGSLLNSVVSIDPLTPAYISDVNDLPDGMKRAIAAGKPVPTDPNHNNDYYGTSKYVEDATGNPLYQRDRHDTWTSGVNVRGTVAANIKPFSGFTYTSRLGYRISQSNYHNYAEPYHLNSMANSAKYEIASNANNSLYYQWENFANYLKTFGKHSVGAMVGMSFTKNHWDNNNISAEGSDILSSYEPNFRYIDYLLASATKKVNNSPTDATELSYFGRVSYSYDNRYFFQANFRRDAFDTSKLSKQARWGNFPSFSAGWAISNEKFFKDHINRDAISYLKLRGSWGKNGNVNILHDYQYQSPIASNANFYQYNPSSGDGKLSYGSKPTGLANPDLTWETSEQVDLGLDARFLNDRLTLGLDWYRKTTKDLLLEVSPLPEIGVSKTFINTGKVLNTGLDFEIGWKDHIRDFKYSVSVNGSTLKNEVQDMSKLVSRINDIGIDGFNNELKPTFEKGHSVWYFRGYKYAGVDENGDAQFYTKDGGLTKSPSDEDKMDLGAGIPKFTYGITINAEYKGFDLTIFGTGSAGNKIYNLMVSADRPKINGIDTYWKDSWREGADNSGAKYPNMKTWANSWKFFSSSAAVFSGAYFKFKQIQLGYTLPKAISSVAGISNLRVFCSLDDFFTITKYPGADPETASMNSGASRGFDNGTYPTSKKLVFGVNVTF
ncbi:MAG: TonB-dependent receptor [Prevotella sp.]|nr:TonB-dependent receptor [Prevotella sp.]